jgi:hypothetical protein
MESGAGESHATADPPPAQDPLTILRVAGEEAMRVASAAFALLRAELRLARSSAFVLIWLSFALVFLGVGAWLATTAAIAAGIYQLTGNVFYGVGTVALANIVGVIVVLMMMRGCWRDLSLPRTRRVLADLREPTP